MKGFINDDLLALQALETSLTSLKSDGNKIRDPPFEVPLPLLLFFITLVTGPGSNVIPRRARSGLTGLRPHTEGS